jgi:hypothetical protein
VAASRDSLNQEWALLRFSKTTENRVIVGGVGRLPSAPSTYWD